jgi:hypothetical protein
MRHSRAGGAVVGFESDERIASGRDRPRLGAIRGVDRPSSVVIRPPADFPVTLACTVADPGGQTVVARNAAGTGHVEFSEFKRNLGLAGQLATVDAVSRRQTALAAAPELQK